MIKHSLFVFYVFDNSYELSKENERSKNKLGNLFKKWANWSILSLIFIDNTKNKLSTSVVYMFLCGFVFEVV